MQYKTKTIFDWNCDKCNEKIKVGDTMTLEYFDKYNTQINVVEAYQLAQKGEIIKTLVTCKKHNDTNN